MREGNGVRPWYVGERPPCTKESAAWERGEFRMGEEDEGGQSVLGGPRNGWRGRREVVL